MWRGSGVATVQSDSYGVVVRGGIATLTTSVANTDNDTSRTVSSNCDAKG